MLWYGITGIHLTTELVVVVLVEKEQATAIVVAMHCVIYCIASSERDGTYAKTRGEPLLWSSTVQ